MTDIQKQLAEALQGLEEAYCRAGTPLSRAERNEDRARLIAARAVLAAHRQQEARKPQGTMKPLALPPTVTMTLGGETRTYLPETYHHRQQEERKPLEVTDEWIDQVSVRARVLGLSRASRKSILIFARDLLLAAHGIKGE